MRRPLFCLFFSISVIFSVHCASSGTAHESGPTCSDSLDNDNDGLIDCNDPDCSTESYCNTAENCTNGTDDDGDGFTDCADAECVNSPACNTNPEICNNGADDDGDGAIDCADVDCTNNAACQAIAENCTNGLDDDGDGFTDCEDADCNGDASCGTNLENCSNGVDDDGDGFADCDDADCATASNCNLTENCSNGYDDDGDGYTDCADSECTNDSACQSTCSEDTIWYTSPDTCPGAEQCGMYVSGSDISVECLPDATFAGGSFYDACGVSNECPFGSICNGDYCAPFCDAVNTPSQHTCPSGGICLFVVSTTNQVDIGLCKEIDNCDVTNVTSCGATQQCILTAQGTVCLDPGQGYSEGTACNYIDDCAAGLICVGTCEQSCNNPGGTDSVHCTSGSCGDLVDENNVSLGLPYGVCL